MSRSKNVQGWMSRHDPESVMFSTESLNSCPVDKYGNKNKPFCFLAMHLIPHHTVPDDPNVIPHYTVPDDPDVKLNDKIR